MAVQVSVFLENQPGQLERVTGVLAEAGVNIRAMTLAGGAGAWGVLSLLVDDPDHAVRALRSRNLPATTRRIAVVEMEDRPGGLHRVVKILAAAGINVENAYGTVLTPAQRAILVIDAPDLPRIEEVLRDHGVRLLSDEEVYGL